MHSQFSTFPGRSSGLWPIITIASYCHRLIHKQDKAAASPAAEFNTSLLNTQPHWLSLKWLLSLYVEQHTSVKLLSLDQIRAFTTTIQQPPNLNDNNNPSFYFCGGKLHCIGIVSESELKDAQMWLFK